MDDCPLDTDLPPQIRELGNEGGALTIGDQRWVVHLESAVLINETGSPAHELRLTLRGPYGRTRRACVLLDAEAADSGDRMEHVFKALAEWLPNSDTSEVFAGRF
jgi:hypothetical protein